MPRYIDADKAEKAIAAIMPSLSTPDGSGVRDEIIFAAQEMCADALKIIHNQPTADVAEVMHGEWIDMHALNFYGDKLYKCSECGFRTDEAIMSNCNYCQECGAKNERR